MKGKERRILLFIEILMISVGLSLDVFAYALYKGAMMPGIHKPALIKIGCIFTLWQMASLLLGNMITNIPMVKAAEKVAARWHFLSILIFSGLGLYMIFKGRRHQTIIEHKDDKVEIGQIAVWACITSMDAFLAGIGFGLFRTNFLITVITVGIVTAVSVILGIYAGYWMGCQAINKIVTLGGCILLIGGIELLIRGIN